VRRALLAVAVLALAGCGGGSDSSSDKANPPPQVQQHKALPGESVVRGWTRALYNGQYERAANYFARGAIVQQSQTVVLTTHVKALAFNLSLPCRAKVTGVRQEPRGVLLASFKLFPGRGGLCARGGTARVRFFIRRGKIESWRQLPQAPAAPSQST
jgi:hypothetical protein